MQNFGFFPSALRWVGTEEGKNGVEVSSDLLLSLRNQSETSGPAGPAQPPKAEQVTLAQGLLPSLPAAEGIEAVATLKGILIQSSMMQM